MEVIQRNLRENNQILLITSLMLVKMYTKNDGLGLLMFDLVEAKDEFKPLFFVEASIVDDN